jgi:spore coat polysaccharide biosynthesis protein SpsF (cytidylyltransferase family)
MSNAAIVVTARTESSRLPGKISKCLGGVEALEHIVSRAQKTGLPVVIATPREEPGENKYNWMKLWWEGVTAYQGEDESPLHRLAAVAKVLGAEWIVRVTADDILIDADEILSLVNAAKNANATVGYVVSDGIVNGAGVEVIHRDNLLAAAERRVEPTEYVSYFVKGTGLPRPAIMRVPARRTICRDYRLTMDYPEDAQLLDLVLTRLGADASVDAVCQYLDERPNLLQINRMPLLSIYTCAYNAERWISEAMLSVLGSMFGDFEYIVVDDCSKDETATLAAGFLSDKRVKLITNPVNMGLASSSNVALRACRGRYVMRLDADDILLHDFSRHAARLIARAESGAQVVYPSYAQIDEAGRVLKLDNDPRDHHHIGGALVEKKLLDEVRFKDGLRHWDGLELYTRFQALGARIEYYDWETWGYRRHDASMSASEPGKRAQIKASIMDGKGGIPHGS